MILMDNDDIFVDETGNNCKKSEIIEIELDDEIYPNEKRKVCPTTRQNSLRDLDTLVKAFDILFDPDIIENTLVGLTPAERDKIYNHPLYDDRDLETKKGWTIQELLP